MTKAPKRAPGASATPAAPARGHKLPEGTARAILDASLKASGFVPAQIAAQLGLSPAEVRQIEAADAAARQVEREKAHAEYLQALDAKAVEAEAAPPAPTETKEG